MTASLRYADSLDALRKEIAEVEAEQSRLCDQDEFDEAERLDETLQTLHQRERASVDQVRAAEQKAEALTESMLRFARERQELAELAFDRIKALQFECEEESKFKDDDNRRKMEDQEQELENLRATAERLRTNVERDSSSYLEDKEQVDKLIGELAAEDVQERDQARERLEGVDDEIRKLQEELQRKLEHRVQLTQAIDACEEKIRIASSKFEKQLRRVDNKRLLLDESQKKFEQGEQKVSKMADDLELKRQAFQADREARRRQAVDVQREARRLRGVRRFVLRNVSMRNRVQNILGPSQEERNKAQVAVERAKAECTKLVEVCATFEVDVDMQRSQREQALTQITALEAAKKAAAETRSFKEAGRLKGEIEKYTQQAVDLEEALKQVEASLAAARKQLGDAREAEECAQAEMRRVESKCFVEELRVARRQLRDLEKLRARLAASSADRPLLDQEIKVIRQFQDHLAQKCGIGDLETLEPIESAEDELSESDGNAEPDEQGKRDQNSEDGVLPLTPSGDLSRAAVALEAPPSPVSQQPWPRPVADETNEEEPPAQATAVKAAELAAEAEVEAEVPHEVSSVEATSPTSPAEPQDLAALRKNRDELRKRHQELQAEETTLAQAANAAAENDDFDAAEELDSQREAAAEQVREAAVALEAVLAKLAACEAAAPAVEAPDAAALTPSPLVEEAELASAFGFLGGAGTGRSDEADVQAESASAFGIVGDSGSDRGDEADVQVAEAEPPPPPEELAVPADEPTAIPVTLSSPTRAETVAGEAAATEATGSADAPDEPQLDSAPASGFAFVTGAIAAEVAEDTALADEPAEPSAFGFVGSDGGETPPEEGG